MKIFYDLLHAQQNKVGTEALVTMTSLLNRPPTTHNNLQLSKQLNQLITIVTSNPNVCYFFLSCFK